MVAEPVATPVTNPVIGSTVAAAVLLLLQLPAPVPLLVNRAVELTHKRGTPLTIPPLATSPTVTIVEAVADPQTDETV